MIEAIFSSMLSLKYTVKLFSPMKKLFHALGQTGRLWQKMAMRPRSRGRVSSAIPLSSVHGGDFGSGQGFQDAVLQGYCNNPVVYRCVSMMARSLGAVKMQVLCDGMPVLEHPLARMISRPSRQQPYGSWMESIVTSLLLDGNAFIHASALDEGKAGSGWDAIDFQVLRPDRMTIVTDERGGLEGYRYRMGQHKVDFGFDSQGYCPVLHLRMLHPLDDHRGLSPLVPARLAVAMHTQSTRHNVALAENQCRPSGLLFVRGRALDEDNRRRLEDNLRQLGSGGAGSILLLNGDFEWQDLGIKPRDMDFIQLMQTTQRNIADCFGVPEPCLNGADRSQYPGYFDAARALLWEETLLPLLDNIFTGLQNWWQMIWPEITLGYDKDRIDALIARREKFSEKVANCRDVLTLNEQRALLGYPPLPGGDVLSLDPERQPEAAI